MKIIKYAKIVQFGEIPLKGKMVIQEKIDGSQFRIGMMEDWMGFGSKSIDYSDTQPIDQMFQSGVDQATEVFKNYKPKELTMIFAEYVKKPKHNTLSYERIPKHSFIIFDVVQNQKYLTPSEIQKFCKKFDVECVPQLWEGNGEDLTVDKIKEFLKTPSILGNETVEGIVLKNYNTLWIPPHHTYEVPMMCKYVREEFKERNAKEWKRDTKVGLIEAIIEELKTETRWRKAIEHIRDKGELTNGPKDIGNLLKEVVRDLEEEEGENIKKQLFDKFFKDIKRGVVRGFPEWYKEYLMKEALK